MKELPVRRMTACALAFAAVAVLPALAGVPLRDATGIPVRWGLDVEQPNVTGGRITYYVDPLTSQEEPPGTDTEQTAILAAADAWAASPGTLVRFRDDPSRPAYDRKATDRVNYMGWKSFVLSPFTLATTYVTASNGVITDADVIFNDTVDYVKWATTTPGLAGYADVQAVATHELGLLIGLDHSPVASASMAPVQYTGSISSRTLSPDDVGAVQEAYPDFTDHSRGAILGTLRRGRHRAGRGIPVFALDARTWEVEGSAFTGTDGLYRIFGLPPGDYNVVAAPLASLVPYSVWWARSRLRLIPAFLEEDHPGPGHWPATVSVRAGFPEEGVDLRVRRYTRRAARDKNGGPDLAQEIGLGAGAAGAFETPQEEDWYKITSDGTKPFDVRVRAWGIGSAADPEVAILDADGVTVLAENLDMLPASNPVLFHGPAGIDLDPGIRGFVPPRAGTYFVRVRAEPQSSWGTPGCFYLLQVLPAPGASDGSRP